MISVDTKGQEIWGQGQGVATLVNTDEHNPLFIEYGTGQPNSSSDQIPPLGTITVDGSYSIKAATLAPGVSVNVQPMPGVTQWTPSPQQIVAAIQSINVSPDMILPTGDTTGAQDTANIKAKIVALTSGGVAQLSQGTFYVNCSDPILTNLGAGQFIQCAGDHATIINAVGTGDLFAWVNPNNAFSDGRDEGGGLTGGATIDGSGMSGPGVAVHAGDIGGLRFDYRAQHFNQSGGSWGLFLDNRKFWSERYQLNVRVKDCGFAPGDGGHFGFNVSGAVTSTASFKGLQGRFEITEGTNQQDGIVLNNGAHVYDFDLVYVGNFTATGGATAAAALRIIGAVPAGHPGAGTRSNISNGRFDGGPECSAGANPPITFVQGNSSNSVTDCYGNFNWNQNFAGSGITGSGWRYDGQVQGDSSLGTRRSYGDGGLQTLTGNGQTISSIAPSAKLRVSSGVNNYTGIILSPGDKDGQVIWLINVGAGSITFAAVGSNLAQASVVIPPGGQHLQLIWDAFTALWF